jgi:hypothetical protein
MAEEVGYEWVSVSYKTMTRLYREGSWGPWMDGVTLSSLKEAKELYTNLMYYADTDTEYQVVKVTTETVFFRD